ncbi:f-box domain-containing protein [Fusarium mexicanum]|uniref:F-box domain-containing protein n=1 Tax=Fusarium mexicanum TaxID=751941 RepID=A0A8H5MR53_9HYPO|nr:f-box domain-containing protein [Fusarium mexicanum]
MALWASPQPEIRRIVFPAALSQSPVLRASVLAAVCREWQDFFERSTFKDLALASGDLYAFASAIQRNAARLGYIRTLRLRINLMPYSIPFNQSEPYFKADTNLNNEIFTQAIVVLLKVLSLWKGDYGGLELELDARSPSDCMYFDFIHELHGDFLFCFQDEDELFDAVGKFYEKRHEETHNTWGSLGSVTFSLLLAFYKQQLPGRHLQLKPSLINRGRAYSRVVRNLPPTPIVKGLVIRRAAPRVIALESLGRIMRESFMALEYFSYSTYTELTNEKERDFLNGWPSPFHPNCWIDGGNNYRSFYTAIAIPARNAQEI